MVNLLYFYVVEILKRNKEIPKQNSHHIYTRMCCAEKEIEKKQTFV